MCSHYQAVTALERFERHFRTAPPPVAVRSDMWPAYPAPVVISPSGQRQAIMARWGLVAASAKTINPKLSTFNARSESAATSPTFGGAWQQGQRCIVPAEAVYEPDWRSGKHVATRITRADDAPLGVAGLWSSWKNPVTGLQHNSFTMLTINADTHPIFKELHRLDAKRPADKQDKRMVVILNEDSYDAWLTTTVVKAREFFVQYPTANLLSVGVPKQNTADLF